MQGYCFKCRHSQEIKNVRKVKLRNGKPALEGKCSKCDGRIICKDNKMRKQ